ncbi:hypothetical protein SLS62_008326 [Diatrype stigma]|uniref:Acyltransferase 3 domain-containing protein n=1 Tax=Diatrype stigma TaxID=117547 RepID=A0AAN9ULW2_9PEZI
MHWSPPAVERGTTATGEESLSLMEGGSDLDAHHRRSSSFEEEEDEKDVKMHRRRRGWSGVLSEWRAQLSRAVLPSAPLPYTQHPESFWRRLRAYIQAVLFFLLPSFLVEAQPPSPQQQHGGGSGSDGRTKSALPPLSPTAYFDGLRGVAALIVYVFHFGYNWYPSLRDGYGAPGSRDSFWQLPIVRVLHSGRSSVTIFFVLSGYVVTAKTVSLLHPKNKHQPQQQQQQQVLHSLSGALFRRPFRLYLPIAVSTLLILVLVRLGAFPGHNSYGAPPAAATWGEQLAHWWQHMGFLVSPFRPIDGRIGLYSPPYDGHLWTIPIEFKGSLTVFALILALARVRCWLRLAGVAGAAAWLVQRGDADGALFCAGLLLAEIALIVPPWALASAARPVPTSSTLPSNSADLLPSSSSSEPSDPLHYQERIGGGRGGSGRAFRGISRRTLGHVWTIALFVLALHLLSYPETKGFSTPGYRSFSRHVPAFYAVGEERCQQFSISVGAVLFLIALMYSPPVRRVPGAARLAAVSAAVRRSAWAAVQNLFYSCFSFLFLSSSASSNYSSLSPSPSPSPSSSSSSSTRRGEEADGAVDIDLDNIHISSSETNQQHPPSPPREEPLLQRPFTTTFSQYLGRISYALYLAHGTVNAAVGERWLQRASAAWAHDHRLATALLHVYAGAGTYSEAGDTVRVDDLVLDLGALRPDLDSGRDGEAVYEGALARARLRYAAQALCALVVNTLVLLWASDVFWRAVDARAVRATRRLWVWASKPTSSSSSSASAA